MAFPYFNHACNAGESARLYVDFSVNQVQKMMAVISRTEVQKDLRLTSKQLAEIKNFRQKRPKDIPSLTNLLVEFKAATGAEKKTIDDEISQKIDGYLQNSLSNVLLPDQSQRFQEIMLQVDGLKSLKQNQKLENLLNISNEQTGEIRDTFALYEPILTPLYRRLGRQMIAGLSGNETIRGRKEQVMSLATAITIIEKERDRDFNDILNAQQNETWKHLLGRRLQIHWPLEVFL
jgi:hypothetical protein